MDWAMGQDAAGTPVGIIHMVNIMSPLNALRCPWPDATRQNTLQDYLPLQNRLNLERISDVTVVTGLQNAPDVIPNLKWIIHENVVNPQTLVGLRGQTGSPGSENETELLNIRANVGHSRPYRWSQHEYDTGK